MKNTVQIKKIMDFIVDKLHTLDDIKFGAEVDDKIKDVWLAGYKSALIGVYVLLDEEKYEVKK